MPSRARTVAFIECKTLGHSWDEYNPSVNGYDVRAYDRMTLRCTRCGTTRHTYMDRDGSWIGSHSYRHPDGYKTAKDEYKPSRAVMRLLMHGHSIPRGVE